jgi:hypothetical protein
MNSPLAIRTKIILEYSCDVWDNCGQMNADRVEKINLEAARIITGSKE